MSQKRGPFPLMPLVVTLVAFALIYALDRITHDDGIAIIATILICAALIVRWIWRGRYS
jgi:lipopolysaccharide export LptBFGC system permease protein LptF